MELISKEKKPILTEWLGRKSHSCGQREGKQEDMETVEICTEVAQGARECGVRQGVLTEGRVLFFAMRKEANP